MTKHLQIVGGGIGGLVAAISAREAGFDVTLYEARSQLGGRARTTSGPYRANWGPHALYSDGPLWVWLEERDLARPVRRLPAVPKVAMRVGRRARLVPPKGLLAGILRLRRSEAPVETEFRAWAAQRLLDPLTAERISNLMGVATFDHDPGRLSAAFVNERLTRATAFPPVVRYPSGGWASLISRLADRAGALGVRIATSSPVDELPPAPVILAIPLDRAGELLGDKSLRWSGTRTALLDVAVRRRRADPFIVSDLDASGWAEVFSKSDPSLAPPAEQLVQTQAGLRPGETLEEGVERLESLLDCAFEGWRTKETWRRRMVVSDESGALDLPGYTWRDRPAGDRGDGVHLVGDMVAAPGLLSEVSFRSAVDAVDRLSSGRSFLRAA